MDQITFEKLPRSGEWILLCFQAGSGAATPSLETIEKASAHFPPSLHTYLVAEDNWDFFRNKYDFWGAPIYLLLKDKEEKDRLQGKISEEILLKFITRNLS
jgi:hypothetical protein